MKHPNTRPQQVNSDTIFDDKERQSYIERLTRSLDTAGLESLVCLFCELRHGLEIKNLSRQCLLNEIDLLLRELFKHSNAFKLAFELYAERFYVRGGELQVTGTTLEEMLTQIKAAKLDQPKKAAEPITTPTVADIEGFARTLEALRSSESVPEILRQNLSEAVDEIYNLEAADETDPLSLPVLTVWLPKILKMKPAGF
ncbi:MAG: hypothetical protein HY231_21810 [Acidobacteria bacterium]|nr:hypothetical protein [Acidobacteriota bacterium]